MIGHSFDGVPAGWIIGEATLPILSGCGTPLMEIGSHRGETAPPAIGVLGTNTGAARLAESVEGVLAIAGGLTGLPQSASARWARDKKFRMGGSRSRFLLDRSRGILSRFPRLLYQLDQSEDTNYQETDGWMVVHALHYQLYPLASYHLVCENSRLGPGTGTRCSCSAPTS